MKAAVLLTAPLVLLAACASTTGPTNGASTLASAATLYCWQGKLTTEGDAHTCNWAQTPRDACRSTQFATLRAAALAAAPQPSKRRCENGEWLVQVTTR